MKLQVEIKQENEVEIKLRVENGDHLPKLDGRMTQEHFGNLGRRLKMVSPSLLISLWKWRKNEQVLWVLEFK